MPAASNRGRGVPVSRHVLSAVLAALALLILPAAASAHHGKRHLRHIVVIYEENHSFDNLYGGWEGVDGLSSVDINKTVQVNQNGDRYGCLLQVDVNLTSPPL